MKVLFLIVFCFMLSGCATFGDYGSSYQTSRYSNEPVRVITQPRIIEQPDYPAPDRYLYLK